MQRTARVAAVVALALSSLVSPALGVTALAAPANDNFASAASLALPAVTAGNTVTIPSVSGTLVGATLEAGGPAIPASCGSASADVWYQVQAPTGGMLQVSVSGPGTLGVAAYDSPLSSLALEDCRQTTNAATPSPITFPTPTFSTLAPGINYIRVYTADLSATTFTLDVTLFAPLVTAAPTQSCTPGSIAPGSTFFACWSNFIAQSAASSTQGSVTLTTTTDPSTALAVADSTEALTVQDMNTLLTPPTSGSVQLTAPTTPDNYQVSLFASLVASGGISGQLALVGISAPFSIGTVTDPSPTPPPTTTGPVASNVAVSPDPANTPPTITATVSDATSTIAAAEYSLGASAAAAGSGTPMHAQDGAFDTATENVTATIDPAAFSALADGSTTVWVRGKDAANTWGAAVSATFAKDTVAPAAPVASPAAGTFTTAQSVTLSAEAGATMRYTLDGTTPSATVGTLYNGRLAITSTMTLKAVAIDAAGNASAAATNLYSFVAVPTVTSISPTSGPTSSGTPVTITGTGFSTTAGATTVTFGSTAATRVSCTATTSCTATSPAVLTAGTVDVLVTVAGQTSAANPAQDAFTYVAAGGQTSQTITFTPLADQVYGAPPVSISASASSGLPVSFSSSTPTACTLTDNGNSTAAVTIEAAGTCTVTAAQAGNTMFAAATSVSQSFSVQPAPLTVTASSPTSTYSGSVPAITPGYQGFVHGDTAATLSQTGNTAPTCTSTAPPSGAVGSYTTSCSGGADPNYAISYVAGTLQITPAALGITARDQSTTFGAIAFDASPAGMSFSGFVNGESPAVLGAGLKITSPVTATSPAGTYPLTPAGAVDANYTITYTPGTLTVNATAPGAPTNLQVVPGDGTATVTWSAPASNGGSSITSYAASLLNGTTVVSTQSITNLTSLSASFNSLTNGTQYTVSVVANNAVGSGTAAAATVTPGGAPTFPSTMVPVAAAGDAQAVVAWTAATSNGSPITAYTVYTYTGTTLVSKTPVAASATSAVIIGLSNGTTYTFRVSATNASGEGPQSAASNSVRPAKKLATSLWTPQSSPGPYSYFDVSCPGPTTCYAVGVSVVGDVARGVIAATTDGSTWTQLQNPASVPRYHRIACPSESVCYVIADTGDQQRSTDVFVTQDGGKSWTHSNNGHALVGLNDGLQDIACPNVTPSGASTTTTCYITFDSGSVSVTTDGNNWEARSPIVGPPGSGVGSIEGARIACPDTSTCYVVGEVAGGNNLFANTADGGGAWSVQVGIPGFAPLNVTWHSIACPSTTSCFAVGQTQTFNRVGPVIAALGSGGKRWTLQSVPSNGPGNLTGVACANQNTCVAVGSGIVKTTNGGKQWTQQTTRQDVVAVASNGSNFYVVGGPGIILKQ